MKKVIFSVVGGFLIAHSSYAVTPGHLVDVVYNWHQPVSIADVDMEVITDPGPTSTYYWSHFFVFQGNTGPGWTRAGYAGLQTIGDGKQAIFSIWNALAAVGSRCAPFGGEGAGYNCKISYDFVAGRPYRIRVLLLSSDSTGEWWGAWVRDNQTNIETSIGSIKSPPNSGNITTSFLFDEYFTNVNSCSSMAQAKVSYTNLTGNSASVTPNFSYYSKGAACPNNIFITFTGNNFTVSSPHPSLF